MPYEDAKTYRFNPFDLTKIWPHSDYPLIKVGKMTLNRNPENFFAQIEQAAFEPSALVPGIGFSPDKMLLGRVFAYSDTHRYRIGPNYLQLPVNQPQVDGEHVRVRRADAVRLQSGPARLLPEQRGGAGGARPTCSPEHSWEVDGDMVRTAYTLRAEDDDFSQPHALVTEVMDDASAGAAGGDHRLDPGHRRVPDIRERVFDYWRNVDKATGDAVAELVRATPGDRAARSGPGQATTRTPQSTRAEGATTCTDPSAAPRHAGSSAEQLTGGD